MKAVHTCALLFAIAFLSSDASAQQLFDLGPKLGINRDDLMTSYRHEPLIGGNAGLFARVKPPIFPGLQGELLLTSIGSHVTGEGYEADLRGLSLQAPLFIIFGFGPFELHAGGYYQRQLTESFASNLGIDIPIEGDDLDPADLADDGYGLLLGAGVHFGHLYAGARYNMDMSPLGGAPFLDDVYGRQVQVYVAFGLFGNGD